MNQFIDTFQRSVRRITILAIPLVVTASGTAAAHAGDSFGGGMMGGGGWGLFGGAMGLWGLLWMGLLLAVPLLLVYAFVSRDASGSEDRARSVLREQYARGDLTAEEFETRRDTLDRSE